MMPDYIILCDFDGTITTVDSNDALFERFCPPAWRDLDLAWQRGEISTAAQITRCYGMIDAPRAEIDAFLDGLELDSSFPAFAAGCMARGWPIEIVSDGLDYHIERILVRAGVAMPPIVANHMAFEDGAPRFAFQRMCPYSCRLGDRSEGVCKRLALERARERALPRGEGQVKRHSPGELRPQLVFVGDGASDRCAVAHADIVFAKGALAGYCTERAIPYHPFATFADVAAALFERQL